MEVFSWEPPTHYRVPRIIWMAPYLKLAWVYKMKPPGQVKLTRILNTHWRFIKYLLLLFVPLTLNKNVWEMDKIV